MFTSVLVANRGEIACRIIRTARTMGLRTIAIYSDADEAALHVREADQAVHIGPAAASDSYLRTDRIIEAALATGAGAIHPGYGFLSERPDLVRGCAEHGITWVGPHHEAINAMGSKIEAKAIALAAGVPCIPGYAGQDQSDQALFDAALKIGFPIMVKASSGGGGKGMRAVLSEVALKSAITSARTEAERSFGDGRLLVEKLVQNPRHVEVQLLGDKHGNIVHLFERDCSVQRNHQKLLEEAPAPNMRDETRAALYEAALNLGREIGYDSAGTVEFIMDAATEEFFFLEMNTRLQVEHTVTEEVTGLDLVEQQLRVASGGRLAFTQDDIRCTGHAIEARLTAEDAADGFQPQVGEILHWQAAPGIRCDSGVREGSVISSHYDSLVAKLISHGTDRAEAVQKLARGLETLEIAGPRTTRVFLRDAILTPRFAEGHATTDFLSQEWPDGWKAPAEDGFAEAALALHTRNRPRPTPWQALGGFRLLGAAGHPAQATYVDRHAPERRNVVAEGPDGFELCSDEAREPVSVSWTGARGLSVVRRGVQGRMGALIRGGQVHIWAPGFDAVHDIVALGNFDATKQEEAGASPDRISAPMPGLIVEVRVAEGNAVKPGQTLIVMESMKLLMELKAMESGSVESIAASAGHTVDAGALLMKLALDGGKG